MAEIKDKVVTVESLLALQEYNKSTYMTAENPIGNGTMTMNGDLKVTNNIQVGENVICDYPVEQGIEGVWTYRKWNSGISECWCNINYNMISIVKGGDDYVFNMIDYFGDENDIEVPISFPKDLFNNIPCVNLSLSNDNNTALGIEQAKFKISNSCQTKDSVGNLFIDFTGEFPIDESWSGVRRPDGLYEYLFPNEHIPMIISIDAKGRWK